MVQCGSTCARAPGKKDLLDGNERKDQKVPGKIAARFGDMGLRDRRLKGR